MSDVFLSVRTAVVTEHLSLARPVMTPAKSSQTVSRANR